MPVPCALWRQSLCKVRALGGSFQVGGDAGAIRPQGMRLVILTSKRPKSRNKHSGQPQHRCDGEETAGDHRNTTSPVERTACPAIT